MFPNVTNTYYQLYAYDSNNNNFIMTIRLESLDELTDEIKELHIKNHGNLQILKVNNTLQYTPIELS